LVVALRATQKGTANQLKTPVGSDARVRQRDIVPSQKVGRAFIERVCGFCETATAQLPHQNIRYFHTIPLATQQIGEPVSSANMRSLLPARADMVSHLRVGSRRSPTEHVPAVDGRQARWVLLWPLKRRRICAALSCLALLVPVTQASAADARRVLLLHAFGHPFSPWSDMAASFRAELIKKSPNPIDLYEVSLDTARVQGSQDDEPFLEYIRALILGRKLELIVPVGAPAASFMQRHRAELFPGTPMLIMGAARRFISGNNLSDNDTGVLLDLPLPVYFDNILRLQPDAKCPS
jgi:hypothetical protein